MAIQAVLSQWTGVPVQDPDEADQRALAALDSELRRRLLGQGGGPPPVSRAWAAASSTRSMALSGKNR